MKVFKRKARLTQIAAVFLSVLFMGGCATAIKYSYDTKTNFSEQKSYTWALSSAQYRQDSLLEKNVQTLADQLLAEKGFTRTSEKPDLILSMSYEFESVVYQYNYRLRMLTLNVYKNKNDMPSPSEMPMYRASALENKDLVWRGTAVGCICTDASSGDLKKAVQEMLLNFPPR